MKYDVATNERGSRAKKKLRSSNDDEEKKKIRKRLKEIAIQCDKELEDCPFAH